MEITLDEEHKESAPCSEMNWLCALRKLPNHPEPWVLIYTTGMKTHDSASLTTKWVNIGEAQHSAQHTEGLSKWQPPALPQHPSVPFWVLSDEPAANQSGASGVYVS